MKWRVKVTRGRGNEERKNEELIIKSPGGLASKLLIRDDDYEDDGDDDVVDDEDDDDDDDDDEVEITWCLGIQATAKRSPGAQVTLARYHELIVEIMIMIMAWYHELSV